MTSTITLFDIGLWCGGKFVSKVFATKTGDPLVVSTGMTINVFNLDFPQAADPANVVDIAASDWRAWREVLARPGECPCGILKTRCDYHREVA